MAGLDVKVSQLGEVLVTSDNDLLNLVTYDEQNQTYVSGKVKASTMKDYMIGDTDISGIGDGTPTGAIDALDGKIDDNYDEWKEQWKKNGAYNILNNTATTQVVQTVTYTVNPDNKTVVATWSNAPSGSALLRCSDNNIVIKSGTYKLVGCPSGGAWEENNYKYKVYIRNTTDNVDVVSDFGSGAIFTADSNKTYVIYSVVGPNAGASGSLTFKPMITTDLNATYADYVPHAMTNRALTELAKSVSYNALNVADKTGDFSDSITNVPNGEYIAILRIRSKSASGNISTEINLQECTVITNAAQFNHYVSMTKVTVTNNTVTFHSKTYTTATLQDAYIALIPLS